MIGKYFAFHGICVFLKDSSDLVIAILIYINMIGNLKSCFFSHGLDLTYQLTDKTFFQQLRSQVGIQGYRYIVITLRYIASV